MATNTRKLAALLGASGAGISNAVGLAIAEAHPSEIVVGIFPF